MRIYIPSCGRASLLQKGPLLWMPAEYRNMVTFVVYQEEEKVYRRTLNNMSMESVGIVAVPEEVKRIAHKRHFIGKHAMLTGTPTFMMIDDDVNSMSIKCSEDDDNGMSNTRKPSSQDLSQMMIWIEQTLKEYAHVGISGKEGHGLHGNGPYPLTVENTRMMRMMAYRTSDFLSVEHCRLEVMEDFDVTLQLLRTGRPNIVTYWWAQNQSLTNAKGGCSSWRTHELHEVSARRLAELHPGLVTLRQKKNKTGGEFGERTEVTIAWKKAAEQGRAYLEARKE